MKVFIISLCFIFLILIILFYKLIKTKPKHSFQKDKSTKSVFQVSTEFDKPLNFGYKNLWFAVKNVKSKNEIVELLNLDVLGNSNWQNGIHQAYDSKIFITPEVEGWTLICGTGLLNKLEDENEEIVMINKLSSKYGEAQFFYTHRVSECHIWAKSINGKLVRYYSYIGEQGENLKIEGEETDFEKNFNFVNTKSENAQNENYLDDESLIYPDEFIVMKIAKNWSIDPSEIELYKNIKLEFGLVCKFK